jgi:hypothetical protein
MPDLSLLAIVFLVGVLVGAGLVHLWDHLEGE